MINLPAALIANGSAVVLLAIVMLSARKTMHNNLPDARLFSVMVFSSMLQSVVETASFFVDGREGLAALNLILNSFLYLNNIFFAFVWTMYADYKLFSDTERLKRVYRFVAIPALLVAVGIIINIFTPVFFEITAGNIYRRAGCYVIPYLLTYFYLAYGVLLIYACRRKQRKYLFMPAIVFMISIFIGSLLQFFFYGYSLVWIGTAIALASLYINVQNEVTFIDPMTGVFTRQYLMQYLHVQIKNCESGRKMAGIMLDIDRFKSINDTFGHLVGDRAITEAGKLIRDSVPAEAMAARYAGDEFIIIQPAGTKESAARILAEIEKQTERLNRQEGRMYAIHFSVGCSEFQAGDTVDTFLTRIDARMYEDKRQNTELNRRASDR